MPIKFPISGLLSTDVADFTLRLPDFSRFLLKREQIKESEVLRLASLLSGASKKQPSTFPVSFAVATLGTLASSGLNPMMVLHSISGSCEPLSLVGTQAATHLPQVVYSFLVQQNLAYLLQQDVTLLASGCVLSLAAMLLRQES